MKAVLSPILDQERRGLIHNNCQSNMNHSGIHMTKNFDSTPYHQCIVAEIYSPTWFKLFR